MRFSQMIFSEINNRAILSEYKLTFFTSYETLEGYYAAFRTTHAYTPRPGEGCEPISNREEESLGSSTGLNHQLST